MTTVYLLTHGEHEDEEKLGIFDSLELAQSAAESVLAAWDKGNGPHVWVDAQWSQDFRSDSWSRYAKGTQYPGSVSQGFHIDPFEMNKVEQ